MSDADRPPSAAEEPNPGTRDRSPSRRPWTLALVAIVIALAWILAMPSLPIAQPAVFNHARHRAVACATCHRGVETSARATIPGMADCQKCHATTPPGIDISAWQPSTGKGQVPWIQVTRLPDHVMFSHRRHVVIAGLACASCHADIGERTAPPGAPPVRLDMNACLACHRREGASEDCAGCHR